jgi:hypothetical protein
MNFLVRALVSITVVGAVDLEARGGFVINTTTKARFHMKCVNWYGAHSNLYVVHGLESRSLSHIVSKLKESGANCVRLPVSDDMVLLNPVVSRASVLAMTSDECNHTQRALDVMDCVVDMLQRNNILIIFNSHCSWPAWVGAGGGASMQGLWHYGKNHTVYTWIRALEILARRYKVAGIDLRNEIHDQDGIEITWGKSPDITTDWLAASTLATQRLQRIDETMLIIVGGLCWNIDLRVMMREVGPMEAFVRQKLMYSTHAYSFSFWFNTDDLKYVAFTSLILSVSAFLCGFTIYFNHFFYVKYKVLRYPSMYSCLSEEFDVWEFLASSATFHAAWLIISWTYYNISSTNGCSTLAQDSLWLVIVSTVGLCLAGVSLLCKCNFPKTFYCHTFWGLSLCWFSLFAMSFFFVVLYLVSDQAYDDFLKLWALDNRPVPVWVGEFGDDVASPVKNHAWYIIWNFISKRYNLDFAYWAFNGRKWKANAWEDESFGLLKSNYEDFRSHPFVKEIFG